MCVPGERTSKRTSLPRGANQARKEECKLMQCHKEETIRGIQHKGLEKNQDHHTSITHRTGMAHSPCPPFTLSGRTERVGPSCPAPPPLLVAPLPSFQYPRCTVTGVVPPRLGIPQHPKHRSQSRPVHQRPPTPDCPSLPDAPRRRRPTQKIYYTRTCSLNATRRCVLTRGASSHPPARGTWTCWRPACGAAGRPSSPTSRRRP